MGRLKILHCVEHYLPFRCGMQEVVTRISAGLVERGHDVHVATSFDPRRDQEVMDGVTVHQFKISGNAAYGYRWGEVNSYLKLLKEGAFDIIVVFAVQQWSTDLFLEVIGSVKAKKVIVPTGYSAMYDDKYKDFYRELPIRLEKFDRIVYHSKEYRDYFFGIKHGLKRGEVIPNGACEREFGVSATFNLREHLSIPEGRKILLSVGNHTGTKGHGECFTVFSQLDVEDVSLVVIGAGYGEDGCASSCRKKEQIFNLFPWIKFRGGKIGIIKSFLTGFLNVKNWISKNRSVHIIELNRADTIEAFKQADLFLFLSQIECYPIVLIEALAAGLPIVCSEAGASAEIINESKAGWIVPARTLTPLVHTHISEAVQLVEQALGRQDLKDIGRRGREHWRRSHTWGTIVSRYERMYLDVCKDKFTDTAVGPF